MVLASTRTTSLGIVFATVCIDLLGFGLVMPLLPMYGRTLTAECSPRLAGVILGGLMISFSIMQFVFAPVWGRLSDRVGRRPVLLMSLTGSTVFYALLGIATTWRSLPWMFVARIGAGIAGATIPTAQAYIADCTAKSERARGMALIGAAFGLGFTLGPLLGAAALEISWNVPLESGLNPWPGYAASMLSAVALAVAIFKLPESYDPAAAPAARRHFDLASLREALAIPSIAPLLATSFLGVFALACLEGTISLTLLAQLGGPQLSVHDPQAYRKVLLLFAYIGVVQCLVQGVLVRRLARHVRENWLAAGGIGLSIVGFVLMALAAGIQGGAYWLIAATAVEVSGVAFAFPAVQALISRRSDPAEQGGILGAGESVSAIARISGTFFGMQLHTRAVPLPYWLAAGLMVVALLLVSVAVRHGRDWTEAAPV